MNSDSINIILPKLIKRNPKLQTFHYHFYPKQLPLQESLGNLSREENEIINNSLSLRDKENVAFWDAVVYSSMNLEALPRLVSKVNRHNPKDLLSININNINKLYAFIEDSESIVAINSKVICDRLEFHIPMIDFHCPLSENNLTLVRMIISSLKLGDGYILNSGKSYHFIGIDLIEKDKLSLFLGRILLFAPAIDRAWIAHQLMDNSLSLRLGPKEGSYPKIIEQIKAD